MNKDIVVEVAYARPELQQIIPVILANGHTVEDFILRSGILALFPEIELAQQAVSIFGKPSKLTDLPQQGDRIEINRSLLLDPKQARKERAKLR